MINLSHSLSRTIIVPYWVYTQRKWKCNLVGNAVAYSKLIFFFSLLIFCSTRKSFAFQLQWIYKHFQYLPPLLPSSLKLIFATIRSIFFTYLVYSNSQMMIYWYRCTCEFCSISCQTCCSFADFISNEFRNILRLMASFRFALPNLDYVVSISQSVSSISISSSSSSSSNKFLIFKLIRYALFKLTINSNYMNDVCTASHRIMWFRHFHFPHWNSWKFVDEWVSNGIAWLTIPAQFALTGRVFF